MTRSIIVTDALNQFEAALNLKLSKKTNWGRDQIMNLMKDTKFEVLSRMVSEGTR